MRLLWGYGYLPRRVSNCETTIFHRFLLVDGIRFKFRTLEGFGGHFRLALELLTCLLVPEKAIHSTGLGR